MSITPFPQTNGLVSNPVVRKWAGNVLGIASLVETVAVLVDQSIPAIDYAYATVPAGLIIGGLFGIFQLTSTSPNVPTPAAVTSAQQTPTTEA